MSDPAGQAAAPAGRHFGRHAGRLAHRLGAILLALAVMVAAAAGVLAWRLSQGPLASPLLAHWLATAVSADNRPTQIHIGTASLAWNGFSQGVGSPLTIRVTDVTAIDVAGQVVMNVPAAQGALSVAQLLLGRLRPTDIEIDRPELRIRHDASGSVTLDLGGPTPAEPDASGQNAGGQSAPGQNVAGQTTRSLGVNPGNALLAEMTQPVRGDADSKAARSAPLERLSHLRRLRITDARITVIDQRLGATWQAPHASIDMRRQASGAVTGNADVVLALGSQQARLALQAELAAGGTQTHFTARLDDVTPAALASDAPALHSLQALNAPVTLAASGTLGQDLALRDGRLDVRVGAGTMRLGGQAIRLRGIHLAASGSAARPVLDELRVEVAGSDAGPATVIGVSGTAAHGQGTWRSDLAVTFDQIMLAELGALWPPGQGGRGARPWLVQNLTAGTVRNGSFHVNLQAPDDFSDLTLAAATGMFTGEDITVHWLRPVPPAEHVAAILRVLDPDTLEIEVTGGRQHSSLPAAASGSGGHPPAGIELRRSTMRITGIVHPDQFGLIEAELVGSLPETVAVLKEKRLHLLDKHPVGLKDPQGEVTVKLNVRLPLEDKVAIDDIALHVAAHLDAVHVTAIVAGRDLDQGVLDVTADNDGLKAQGHAEVAGFASQLGLEMDFRNGPPSQVVQKITAAGRAEARQLARIGLDAGTVLAGTVGLQAGYLQHRGGEAELSLAVDLTAAALTALMLDWRKPAGRPAHAELHALLDHDHLTGVDHLSVQADGLSVEGHADYAGGKPSVLRLDHMVLGATDAAGTVRFPPGPGGPIRVEMAGRQLDLSARLSQHEHDAPPPAGAPAKLDAGTPYVIDARFARALMSRGQTMSGLSLHVENDGRLFQRARLEGQAGPAAPFRLEIAPERGGRRLSASAADAGQLLRALDIMDGMIGGNLVVNARYADTQPGRPLAGTMTVRDFRLSKAPFLAKLLQGLTLYGLVNLLDGPGLAFSRLEAPFSLTNGVLALGDSRMFNSALGLTARGSIDINADTADLTGTIVPAYFFNSLLGRVPLVGRLFSPERGSGLFAANYAVRGRLADPHVSINPLSALTPGFLRNVFGIF